MLTKQKKHPMFQNILRIIENNFNISFLQKKPRFDSMLEIDNGSMKK
jgi:hypothetical protein